MGFTDVSAANAKYIGILPTITVNFGNGPRVAIIDPEEFSAPSIYLDPRSAAALSPSPNACSIPSCPAVASNEDFIQSVQNMIDGLNAQTVNNSVASQTSLIDNALNRLNSLLKTEGISDEDKEKINAQIEKLEELKKKIDEINKSDKDDQTKSQELSKLQEELNTELKNAANLSVASVKESGEHQGENDPEVETETASSDGTISTEELKTYLGTLDKKLNEAADDADARNLADKFNEAINKKYCWFIPGTDDDKFNEVCDSINAKNVMSVMLAYNKFSHDKESFMEAFMYDADGDQKPKYGKQIADALKEVTIALGIYDDCHKDFDTIYSELDDVSIDNEIYTNYDAIIKKIADKMGGSKYAEPRKD